jgi:hypothetical protein
MPTLRQSILSVVVRSAAMASWPGITKQVLRDWLHTSPVARGIAVEHGMSHEAMLDATWRMNFDRLVSEADRRLRQERKRCEWLRALRGES